MTTSELAELITLRRDLHSWPDLSGEEEATSQRLKKFFKQLHPDEWVENLGPHGFAVIFEGKVAGPVTLLRAELDALPIREDDAKSYISQRPGVAHLCGHDGHMAILCGIGMILSKERPATGRVVLMFQPAEETGEGAQQVLTSENFKRIIPDFAFALHNLPGYRKNQIVLKKGPFTAASKGMIVTFSGRTSHAAHPEDGNSPASAMSKAIVGLENLPSSIQEFSMITVVHAVLGEVAFGTAPGEAVVMATLRTFDDIGLERLSTLATTFVELIAKESGLKVTVSFRDDFKAVVNDEKAWEYVNRAAKENKLKTKNIRTPFRWSEDFGHFSRVTKTVLFGIGAGQRHPQLHESSYDFPDDLIPTGINVFKKILQDIHY